MTRSMAYHPGVQHKIAEIVIELEGMIAHADRIAADWTNGVDHGEMWPAKLVAAKYHCIESAFEPSIWQWTHPAGAGCSVA
jgi:alkylation response protein AidB-like acyl-CoA dehydrogenase